MNERTTNVIGPDHEDMIVRKGETALIARNNGLLNLILPVGGSPSDGEMLLAAVSVLASDNHPNSAAFKAMIIDTLETMEAKQLVGAAGVQFHA